MKIWPCGWEGCARPAAQRIGDCQLCDRYLCRTHRQTPWHDCPTPEDDWESYSAIYAAAEARCIERLCHRVDPSAICSRASMLRGGVPCTIDLSHKSLSAMKGGQNCHANIKFQDDVEWLARFRLQRNLSPPLEVRDYILRSEATTMFYLQQHTRLPTPKIFDWACEADPENCVRIGYILMEKMDATPLNLQAATDEQRETIMQQLADIFIEIEKHPFANIGSLATCDGDIADIQGLALPSVFRSGAGPLGPFTSPLEWSKSIIESYLSMMADGEVDANLRTEVYLYHRFRLEAIGRLWDGVPQGHRFFLKHPDDKGDHILINDHYQIVALIDWEWTHTVSAAEAFSSPCMMWPVANFYKGLNELAPEERRLAAILQEKGRNDLASHVINGRKFQRFFFAIGPESSFLTQKEVADLFVGLQLALNWENVGWEPWKQRALETWEKDGLLVEIMEPP